MFNNSFCNDYIKVKIIIEQTVTHKRMYKL